MAMRYAERFLHILRTHLAFLPSDNDERWTLDEDSFETVEQVISVLQNSFQENPLFTPEFADTHPEIGIMADRIAINGMWPPDVVVTHAMNDDIAGRNLVAVGLAHRPETEPEQLEVLLGENLSRQVSSICRITHRTSCPLSLEEIVEEIREEGSIQEARMNRTITNLMENPHLRPSDVVSAVVLAGCPSAAVEFARNPCVFPSELCRDSRVCSSLPSSYGWFMNTNPETLREVLAMVRDSDITALLEEDATRWIPPVYNCIVTMIAKNPAWDSTMEAKFGDVVWPIVWQCLRELYPRGVILEEEHKKEVRAFLHLLNPSWLISECVWRLYESNRMPWFCYEPNMIQQEYGHVCVSILPFESGSPDTGRVYYRETLLEGIQYKHRLRTRDILRALRINGPFPADTIMTLAKEASLGGDAAVRIGGFLYRKWFVPYRRNKTEQRVSAVLHKTGSAGDSLLSYRRIRHTVVSFLTE